MASFKTVKLVEEHIGENFCDLGVGSDFLGRAQTHES